MRTLAESLISYLIQLFFPNYYRWVWNDEFTKQMEQFRLELYLEYPDRNDIVDEAVNKAIEENLKK